MQNKPHHNLVIPDSIGTVALRKTNKTAFKKFINRNSKRFESGRESFHLRAIVGFGL